MRARPLAAWLDGALDLFLGSRCTGCGAAGRALCHGCRRALPTTAGPAWPTPTPAGLVLPVATGEYAGLLRDLVLAHKEDGRLALARPLGGLLATSVLTVLRTTAVPATRVVLVPVPSHAAAVRARGHDPLLRTARAAGAALRGHGLHASVAPVLRVAGRPQDQAGLDAGARARNVSGRFLLRHGAALPTSSPVVLVDDVLTTGATAREGQRALEEGGVPVLGVAVVAATRRRFVSGTAKGARLPNLGTGH